MTDQEAFTIMVQHLRKQGCQAVNSEGECLYLDRETGNKCAVGALLPEDTPNEILDATDGISALIQTYKLLGIEPPFAGVRSELLAKMQHVHDLYSPDSWEDQFGRVAAWFDLTVPSK